MNYTVLWVAAAEAELARLWTEASRRDEITQAAHEIETRLRVNPLEEGESRPQGRRVLLAPPLGVVFQVVPDDLLVRVLQVWAFQKRR